MKNKKIRLLIGSIVLIGVCLLAIKLEVFQIASAKIQDALADTVVIRYSDNRLGDGVAVVSPDVKQMAFCKETREFFVQDMSTGKTITYPTQDEVYQVKYSSDGKYLVAGRNVLNLSTGTVEELKTDALLIPNLSDHMAFSPNGESLAIVSEKYGNHPELTTIEIWDLKTQQLVQKLPVPYTHIAELSYSRDGRYLAVAGSTINIWDVQEGKCVKTLVTNSKSEKQATSYEAITYSPDGKYLAAGAIRIVTRQGFEKSIQENFIEIWDMERGEITKIFEWENSITRKLKYSPDGRYLATGRSLGMDDDIRDAVWIWDVSNWKVVRKLFQFPNHHITAMDFSNDGKYLSVSGSWHTKIWKIQ